MTDIPPLTTDQRARADALDRARRALVGSTLGVSKVEPTDLHALAVFILDGGDPWTDYLPERVAQSVEGAPLWTTGERDAYAEGLMRAALEEVREKVCEIYSGAARTQIGRIIDEVKAS